MFIFKDFYKKMKFSTKKAFTLLEVMIVLGAIGIMTALMLVAISSSRHKTELEVAANQVSASLREAQNYALTGKMNQGDSCIDYVFTGTTNPSNYRIRGYPVSCNFNMLQMLSGGVVFQGSPMIRFSAPHGDVTGDTAIILQKSGDTIYVCINSVGLVTKSWTGCP